jgi:hypothetical protein
MSDVGIEPLWRAEDAAEFLGMTLGALYRLRLSGKGPAFFLVPGRNKVRYRPSVVVEWLKERERPSMAAHLATDAKRAAKVEKQREALDVVRKNRWAPKENSAA